MSVSIFMKHPIQPLSKDKHGKFRFKSNAIVEFLLIAGMKHGVDLNLISTMNFTDEDRQQFAQLIGYSLDGYGELSYVDDEAWNSANVAKIISRNSSNPG